jgi:hypothetical protein
MKDFNFSTNETEANTWYHITSDKPVTFDAAYIAICRACCEALENNAAIGLTFFKNRIYDTGLS